MINTAGESAAGAVTRTMNELHDDHARGDRAVAAKTAGATVTEMLETHNMLRADTTALFERLREANIMLQEVLSGAHENMSALENTLMLRVSEFVAAMNEVTASTSDATDRGRDHHRQLPRNHRARGQRSRPARPAVRRARPRTRPGGRADRPQQPAHRGQSSPSAAYQLEHAGRHARHPHRGPRAAAQALLRPARRIARSRRRPRPRNRPRGLGIERRRACTSIGEQYERVRAERRRRAPRAPAEAHARDLRAGRPARADTMLPRAPAERFAEIMAGMKQMAAEMQRELEATRAELRRGIFELPQETAESAAQMRRVIVDQIEALAELNRIVARHGRSLDAVEPVRRAAREEPALARRRRPQRSRRHARAPPRPRRRSRRVRRASRPPRRAARAAAAQPPARPQHEPRLAHRPAQPRLARGATSRPAARRRAPQPARGRRAHAAPLDRVARFASVDIARMIDHDAAADLWDRYKRGERNVFTRRLYTLQGQKAFDEIRKQVPRRPRVQADRRPLHRRVRAPARRGLARRPRPGGGAHLSHLGNRQGLHHAGARGRPVRLSAPERKQTAVRIDFKALPRRLALRCRPCRPNRQAARVLVEVVEGRFDLRQRLVRVGADHVDLLGAGRGEQVDALVISSVRLSRLSASLWIARSVSPISRTAR